MTQKNILILSDQELASLRKVTEHVIDSEAGHYKASVLDNRNNCHDHIFSHANRIADRIELSTVGDLAA